MPVGNSCVVVCGSCGEAETEQWLVTQAVRGSLVCVCPRCFHAVRIVELTKRLPASDLTLETVDGGLRALYELVKRRSEELVSEGSQDGA